MTKADIKRYSLKFFVLTLILWFYILSFTVIGFAKELNFEASVNRNKVPLGSSLQLALAFNGTQDMPALDAPVIDGFTVRYLGPSTMMSIVNGKVSASITHNYMLLPTKAGVFKIGPFKFEHNQDSYISNQISVEVLPANAQSPADSDTQLKPEIGDLSERIFVTIQAGKNRAYVNEIIPVKLKLYVNRLDVRDIQYPEFNHEGFSVGAFAKPNQYQEVRNGLNFDVLEFNTSVFGLRPGEFNLSLTQLKCNLIVRKQAKNSQAFGANSAADIFDNFFGRNEAYPLNLKSKDIAFTIVSLPEENKPADFSGSLGNFNLEVTAAPLEVKVGDPITLTMTVNGEGNLNTVSAPKLKSEEGFKIYAPQVKQEANQKRFEQIIMPMNAQVKEVPLISLSFFDQSTNQYKTINQGPFPIKIIESAKEESKLVENKQVFIVSNIKEEKLGRDIIYIKDNPGNLEKKGQYLYKNKIFLGFQAALLLIYLLLAIISAKKQRLKTDLRYARGLLAPKKAQSGIRQAKNYLLKAEAKKFYDTLFTTLQEYLGDRFHLSSKGITISVIDEYLRKAGVEEEILTKLNDIFRECDMVRYAFKELTPENMQDALSKLEKVIDYLQRKKI